MAWIRLHTKGDAAHLIITNESLDTSRKGFSNASGSSINRGPGPLTSEEMRVEDCEDCENEDKDENEAESNNDMDVNMEPTMEGTIGGLGLGVVGEHLEHPKFKESESVPRGNFMEAVETGSGPLKYSLNEVCKVQGIVERDSLKTPVQKDSLKDSLKTY